MCTMLGSNFNYLLVGLYYFIVIGQQPVSALYNRRHNTNVTWLVKSDLTL